MRQMTPPMGWNSWNTFGGAISEKMIMDTADVMVSSGLAAAGYNYLVIDDCWSLKERDENGRIVPDPEKFPHGMKYIADYIHSKGLKFGMYSCCGAMTCAGYPGSYEHEFTDAATFAEWEVDYLKYDYCYKSNLQRGDVLYRRMYLALQNSGRDIMLSACSWGADDTHKWVRSTGANLWRSTGDIMDNWESITSLVRQQDDILAFGGAGCFNDMDMLVVGMHGNGNVGLGGCSDVQYRTHFSVWAMMGSPLMIGCDIRNMSDETLKILTNKEVIAIDQDSAACQVMPVYTIDWERDVQIRSWARVLENGDIALCFANFGEEKKHICLMTDQLSVGVTTGKTLELHNLWDDEVITVKNGAFSHDIEGYDCLMYRAKIVDAK